MSRNTLVALIHDEIMFAGLRSRIIPLTNSVGIEEAERPLKEIEGRA
jgi:hypothetical protein